MLSELVYPTSKVINLHFTPNYIKRKENICFSYIQFVVITVFERLHVIKGDILFKVRGMFVGGFGLFVKLSLKCFSK